MEKYVSHIIDYILRHRVLLHVFYWSIFLILSLLYGWGMNEPFLVSWYLELIYLPFQILASYTFIYFQLPLIYNRRYWLFTGVTILMIYLYASLAHVNYDFGVGTRLSGWHLPHSMKALLTDPEFFFGFFVDVYVVVFFTVGIKLVIEHFESYRRIQALEASNLKSAYGDLQAQLQPEFLLRTIKVIEDTARERIDQAPDIISNLSEILDYRLYGSREAGIQLQEVAEHLRTYLDTYVLSSDWLNSVKVNCDVENNRVVQPLLLTELLESLLTQLSSLNQVMERLTMEITCNDDDINIGFQMRGSDISQIDLGGVSSVLQNRYKGKYNLELNIDTLEIKLLL